MVHLYEQAPICLVRLRVRGQGFFRLRAGGTPLRAGTRTFKSLPLTRTFKSLPLTRTSQATPNPHLPSPSSQALAVEPQAPQLTLILALTRTTATSRSGTRWPPDSTNSTNSTTFISRPLSPALQIGHEVASKLDTLPLTTLPLPLPLPLPLTPTLTLTLPLPLPLTPTPNQERQPLLNTYTLSLSSAAWGESLRGVQFHHVGRRVCEVPLPLPGALLHVARLSAEVQMHEGGSNMLVLGTLLHLQPMRSLDITPNP